MNGRGAGIGRGRRVSSPAHEGGRWPSQARSARRERSARGRIAAQQPAARLPAPGQQTSAQDPRASPGAVPAVRVDAARGGGGGHGAEERGRAVARASGALKGSGSEGTEAGSPNQSRRPLQEPPPRLASRTARFYRARKSPPSPRRHWSIQMTLFTPIGSLECQAS